MSTHHYATSLTWEGATVDYASYSREHRVSLGEHELTLSADPAFRGDPALPNPEQLLVAAASSCQLLSFLALAAKARVEVLSYTDNAAGIMPEAERPVRITTITLRPRIVVRGRGAAKVERLVRLAHEECYIANTLNAQVLVEPRIEVL